MILDLVINQFQCFMKNLLLRELSIIQSICDVDNEEMCDLVDNHLSDRKIFNCDLTVFCIQDIKKSTGYFKPVSACKQRR